MINVSFFIIFSTIERIRLVLSFLFFSFSMTTINRCRWSTKSMKTKSKWRFTESIRWKRIDQSFSFEWFISFSFHTEIENVFFLFVSIFNSMKFLLKLLFLFKDFLRQCPKYKNNVYKHLAERKPQQLSRFVNKVSIEMQRIFVDLIDFWSRFRSRFDSCQWTSTSFSRTSSTSI